MPMSKIRAFIGHSFTDDDEELVRQFLDFFNQLARMNMNFSWEHAVPAEPKELAEKVMSLLSGKNVFIAICTKKEQVIAPKVLNKSLFRPNHFFAQKNEFYWKTSDWIIQEIGLAKGKGLELILLLENGTKTSLIKNAILRHGTTSVSSLIIFHCPLSLLRLTNKQKAWARHWP